MLISIEYEVKYESHDEPEYGDSEEDEENEDDEDVENDETDWNLKNTNFFFLIQRCVLFID